MAVDEVSVDQNLLAGTFVGVKRQWFKQAFAAKHQKMLMVKVLL